MQLGSCRDIFEIIYQYWYDYEISSVNISIAQLELLDFKGNITPALSPLATSVGYDAAMGNT